MKENVSGCFCLKFWTQCRKQSLNKLLFKQECLEFTAKHSPVLGSVRESWGGQRQQTIPISEEDFNRVQCTTIKVVRSWRPNALSRRNISKADKQSRGVVPWRERTVDDVIGDIMQDTSNCDREYDRSNYWITTIPGENSEKTCCINVNIMWNCVSKSVSARAACRCGHLAMPRCYSGSVSCRIC